ncbi:MAG: HAMP domain-containing histidine kinase [Oscillospiraceae bacterium]|jgi:signal transduction histidine kinase|nr:HAMP domain-containing histidine kinase [Oscillospiraceae bacterium]
MNEKTKKRLGLTFSLVLFVFLVMFSAMVLGGLIILILHFIGVVELWREANIEVQEPIHFGSVRIILTMMIFSTFLGTAIAAFFGKKVLKPIRKVIEATKKIAQGDFNVHVDIKGAYELEELSHSFNKMAHELSTIETLRSDFINNFSHEFKTPIVSVRGFAKLLKDGNLTESEKQEYLDIIITESERLAGLSTNILNLSKYENIQIIPDKTKFQLDEQIRRVIALTEPKWTAKNIAVDVEMEEITLEANEDLTQQIWLNLLDNAIKFTNHDGAITIRLNKWNNGIRFIIEDNGIGMSDEMKAHIFDKFYQGDDSRSKQGNGLGLAIVKRIVDLCGGKIEVESELGAGSKYSVILSLQ